MPTLDLYGRQFDFVEDSSTYAALCGGIGSGKSIAGACRALAASLGIVGDKQIPTPNLGMVTAPTYPMLRDATLRTFLDIAGDLVVEFRKAEHIAVMRGGSEILFRSTEHPERLRGPNLSWWWGDEAALYHSSVWHIMIGRLRQFGLQGHAWLTTTPKGRNWLWQEFVQQMPRPKYSIYRVRTRDNPFLADDFIHSLEQSYVGDFALQELEGEFISFEGLIYHEFRRERHVSAQLPAQYQRVIAGVDWGYANPGVIVVVGIDSDARIYVIAEEVARQRRIEEWANLGAVIQRQYGIEVFYCDPSEPDFITAFMNAGCVAMEANNEVLPGIQAVKARLATQGDGRPRMTLSPDCIHTAIEFEQYQWAEHREGLHDKPKKVNDHCMDALRYACMAIEQVPAIGDLVRSQYDTLSGSY